MEALKSAPRAAAGGRGARSLPLAAVLIGLAVFFVSQYAGAWSVPFINDDYIFLDKTRSASFVSLWKPEALAFHWYRPWSRELHYWTLQHLFGTRELPFHLVSWALALAVLGGAFVLFRRLAGTRAATVAVAGLATLSAWGVPMVWIAGVQDLWMLAFTIAFLLAVSAGARGIACVALALALLSKEAAAVLPALALAHRRFIDRRALSEALRWIWPMAVIVAAWALFHPVLGGRLWEPIADPLEPGLHPPLYMIAGRTLAVPVNLDALPRPERPWSWVLARALPGALALGALMMWGARRASPPPRPAGSVLAFAGVWALAGWAPLLLPTLGWHSYYALLGALGAWLALGVLLARRPGLALALVTLMVVLRSARADTPSRDWGSEWYQRRAGSFITFMRADLRRIAPDPPPHSRFYFVRVPSNVGFLAGDAPALRVWYGDSTLRGGYYPAFRPRLPSEPPGEDRFFRFDVEGWVPVVAGAEDVAAARRENPRWVTDHETLAGALAKGGDWAAAATEYEKLAAVDSSSVEFAYNAAVCRETLGDSTGAALWYERAASLPGADAEIRADALRLARHRPRR